MTTINYNGMELEEVTTPQIFDPPQEMLVIDELDDKPIKKRVAAFVNDIMSQLNEIEGDNGYWFHLMAKDEILEIFENNIYDAVGSLVYSPPTFLESAHNTFARIAAMCMIAMEVADIKKDAFDKLTEEKK